MDTRDTPATKASDTAEPKRVHSTICTLGIFKAFLTQEEIVLHIMACAAYYYEETEGNFASYVRGKGTKFKDLLTQVGKDIDCSEKILHIGRITSKEAMTPIQVITEKAGTEAEDYRRLI